MSAVLGYELCLEGDIVGSCEAVSELLFSILSALLLHKASRLKHF